MRSRWFGAAVVGDGAVWLPARRPIGLAADLGLGSDGVTLRGGGVTARLAWSSHDPLWDQPRVDRAGSWWVASILHSGGGRTGIAVGLDRATEVEIRGVTATADAWARVFPRFFRGDQIVLRAPGPIGQFLPLVDAERDTLRALCQALATRPAMRSRLADPDRARLLVAAMAQRPVRARREPIGARRSTMEVLGALRGLGYRHEIGGRPLSGEPLAAADVIVDRVLDHVGRNPYAPHVSLNRDRTLRMVRRHYLDIQPWPFAALATPPEPRKRAHRQVSDKSTAPRSVLGHRSVLARLGWLTR